MFYHSKIKFFFAFSLIQKHCHTFLVPSQNPKDKNPILKVAKNRKPFKEATFPSNEESRVSE